MSKKSETILKNKILKYVSKKDICCNENIDKKIIIEKILSNYKKIGAIFNEEYDYLSYLNNDIVVFIGYKIDLEKNKDIEGVQLWNTLDRKMYKDKKLNLVKIKLLLNELPLFYLLSLLGYSDYRLSF
jgi:hypothetical protein